MRETTDEIIAQSLQVLSERLPDKWSIEVQEDERSQDSDANFLLRGPSSGTAWLLVEARRRSPSPRDLRSLFGTPVVRRIRARSGSSEIIVVAPYLSPHSREVLREEELQYADLTGNVRLVLTSPGVFVLTEGADRNPFDEHDEVSTGLRGAKAGNLVSVLVEASPPYGVTELATAANISPGYVSKILKGLEENALIERETRGPVVSVDWERVLRERATAVSLMETNSTRTFVSRQGAGGALERLGEVDGLTKPPVVTGSFNAVRRVSVAAPTLLAVYVSPPRDRDTMADQLDLVAAAEGGDTVLLAPPSEGVADWSEPDPRGFLWAGLSQTVIDCLSGPGRMPAEGDALLEWMTEHVDEWRCPSLAALGTPGGWRTS